MAKYREKSGHSPPKACLQAYKIWIRVIPVRMKDTSSETHKQTPPLARREVLQSLTKTEVGPELVPQKNLSFVLNPAARNELQS